MWRVNELIFSSYDIDMVQFRFVEAEKQSATAQQAVKVHAACAANLTSKSQLKSLVDGARFCAAKPEVAIAATIKILADSQGALAESKGQFLSACRELEQDNGRGDCGHAGGEVEVLQHLGLPELIAGRGTGNLRSG